jgi:hypothetical protein
LERWRAALFFPSLRSIGKRFRHSSIQMTSAEKNVLDRRRCDTPYQLRIAAG